LLFEGESSRLYQKLVKGDESVVSIQGGIDERRGPSACYIFALPKPGEEVADIRQQIVDEIRSLRESGPSAEEMEKLRNSLRNDVVRGRQSTMYRAQRLAEYALYDGDPTLIDTELDQYLAITPDEIKNAIRDYLDVDNRVTLDIIPAAMAAGEAASAQAPGEPQQPAAPAPQIPATPSDDEAEVVAVGSSHGGKVEAPQQPADPPKQTETGSGRLHT
jgi:predicted Zn-dependent peptidase